MTYKSAGNMAKWPNRQVRLAILALFCIALFRGVSILFWGQDGGFSTSHSKQALESLSLTNAQCKNMLPGLTKEIEDAVARGPFDLGKQMADTTGLVQGRIRDGKVYIISVDSKASRDMLWVS